MATQRAFSGADKPPVLVVYYCHAADDYDRHYGRDDTAAKPMSLVGLSCEKGTINFLE